MGDFKGFGASMLETVFQVARRLGRAQKGEWFRTWWMDELTERDPPYAPFPGLEARSPNLRQAKVEAWIQ